MKKTSILLHCFLLWSVTYIYAQHQTRVCKDVRLSFFSKAPLENIEAHSQAGVSALHIITGDIIVKVRNNSFVFDKKLMQEHFNENYMESHRYPISEFKGKITDAQKLLTDGSYELLVTGTLHVHGVGRPCSTKVKFIVRNGTLQAATNFVIKLADHHIKIPAVVGQNIAETVTINIAASYSL
ncbi:YceI family protein [Sphingobacterium suaedae]|uniref:YceI family protein n=1 Tax=Sphingobacterium suaedae TaxID=1686402 RepID=A0ABW5KMW7_9SPHI